MKRSIVLLGLVAMALVSSCKKDDKCPYKDVAASAPQTERDSLRSYLANNSITAVEHSSGVFYTVVSEGTGETANICSGLTVKYRGTFIPSGNVFDETPANATASFQLGKVIVGWQKGMSLIKESGKINLYIPPSLAYGPNNVTHPTTGQVLIPGNSYLKFEVELVDVQ